MKKYYVIESTNGNLNTIKEVCKDSKSLNFLGEIQGLHIMTKEPCGEKEIPRYLLFKP